MDLSVWDLLLFSGKMWPIYHSRSMISANIMDFLERRNYAVVSAIFLLLQLWMIQELSIFALHRKTWSSSSCTSISQESRVIPENTILHTGDVTSSTFLVAKNWFRWTFQQKYSLDTRQYDWEKEKTVAITFLVHNQYYYYKIVFSLSCVSHVSF